MGYHLEYRFPVCVQCNLCSAKIFRVLCEIHYYFLYISFTVAKISFDFVIFLSII